MRNRLRRINIAGALDIAHPHFVTAVAYAQHVPRRYELSDLVGVFEIAERLGSGTSVVYDWQRRHTDFPQPVLRLRMGTVWFWPDVEDWARETGRLA